MAMLTGALTIPLAGCGGLFPNKYRFKLTVDVDTPSGSRSGSSVYQVTASNSAGVLPEERKRDWAVKGEAAAVELPNGQLLLSLLRTTNPKRQDLALMSMAAFDPAFRNDVVESAKRISDGDGTRTKAQLDSSEYPLLVLFENPADKTSIREINPAGLASDLGAGYAIRGIAVELTGDAVTDGLSRRLPWLASQQGALIKIPFSEYPPPGVPLPVAARLTERDFSQGTVQ
jgi:hypothetical protein